jgi:hypothetical protein
MYGQFNTDRRPLYHKPGCLPSQAVCWTVLTRAHEPLCRLLIVVDHIHLWMSVLGWTIQACIPLHLCMHW